MHIHICICIVYIYIHIVWHIHYSVGKSIMRAAPLWQRVHVMIECHTVICMYMCVLLAYFWAWGPGLISSALPRPRPHTRWPPAQLTKQLRISDCLQLIAAQPQLIACYACTMPRERERGRGRAYERCYSNWCLPHATYSLEAYQLQTGSRCPVTPFVCLRFQLSLDVL